VTIAAYPHAPTTYPRDPRYVAAAGVLRAARAEWFAACVEPITHLTSWRARVDACNRVYAEALAAVRAEEDRVLQERAMEREYARAAGPAAARVGAAKFGARKAVAS